MRNTRGFYLDTAARHRWQAIAPSARVQVTMEKPRLRWSGIGYLDTNSGDEPLESGFARWDWARASTPDSGTVLYNVTPRQGPPYRTAIQFTADSQEPQCTEAPAPQGLPGTLWRVKRSTPADAATEVRLLETLEDTPFYARSLVRATVDGNPLKLFHESLDLDRFRSRWVQMLLPFRMPRRRSRERD